MRYRKIKAAACLILASAFPTGFAAATEPASCQTVRISDVAWTDNQAINGFAEVILPALGYTPQVSVLSMQIVLESMKNGEIDTHLDFWTPGADSLTDPYIADKTVEKVQTNMTGAQYTLAVPTYLWDAGLKTFNDIPKFKEQLDGKIYGIEPGNDGNTILLQLIKDDKFGLGSFELVESSEQGMLSQLTRMEKDKKAIVFLGWSPHPMNMQHDFKYLSGGEEFFGSESSGWTAARAGYTKECPNVGKFLTNFTFDIDTLNEVMGSILNDGMSGKDAALKWLKANPSALDKWLDGVTTFDGQPGLDAARKSIE
ncbi:MAG: choline ABC transporter substrate-binding protein [Rhizobiales bacterium]|nr:choline ABC transporter substrate-binding protein [Hyphomicrobiales bacterium]